MTIGYMGSGMVCGKDITACRYYPKSQIRTKCRSDCILNLKISYQHFHPGKRK
jgi:hypothetical protein